MNLEFWDPVWRAKVDLSWNIVWIQSRYGFNIMIGIPVDGIRRLEEMCPESDQLPPIANSRENCPLDTHGSFIELWRGIANSTLLCRFW